LAAIQAISQNAGHGFVVGIDKRAGQRSAGIENKAACNRLTVFRRVYFGDGMEVVGKAIGKSCLKMLTRFPYPFLSESLARLLTN
jgi:hypothetical protein